MSVNMEILRRHGVSSGAYKRIFALPREQYPRGIQRLVDLHSARIRDGRTLNLTEWRAFCAIDAAHDVSFAQTTPTIVQNILSRHLNPQDTINELKNWGLSEDELFIKTTDQSGNICYIPNAPVFFQIFIPIVKAYVGIRCSHLYNQLNQDPLLEYKPLKETERNRVVCEVVTDMIDTCADWYGYPAVLRQGIQQMLKYGIALAFPMEEWHCEQQLQDVTDEMGFVREKAITVKEGLRYMWPHPSRMGYDLKVPLTMLNTNSGTEFAFHWRVLSYGDILDNKLYWNRNKIFAGTNWFDYPGSYSYWHEFFPCTMKFPGNWHWGAELQSLREDRAGWYNSGGRDQAVFLTEMFHNIIPKQWGLADYPYPVWHRFTYAGDDTVIWAEPCAYTPPWFMGYDYDENAGRTPSMALECIPWQDHLGNFLSQMILTAKQNLAKVVFYDTNIVDKTDIEKLQNRGEQRYRSTQYIGFDSLQTRVAGLNQAQAFQVPNFGQFTNVTEMLQVLPSILNMMERVLQISAQESGAQASHQQSKEEVIRTGGASSNRVTFIMAAVHEGVDAWKRQLYDASMAYRDPGMVAEVSADIPGVDAILAELGMDVKHKGKEKLLVEGQKKVLRLEGFARTSTQIDRQPDASVAQIIFSCISTIAGQEDLKQKVGADNLLKLLELGAYFGGAPRGFKLPRQLENKDAQVPPNILQAIQQAQQATLQTVEQKIGEPVAQEVGQMQGQLQQLEQVVQQLQKIYDAAQKVVERDQIKAREAATDEQLKQQDHEAEMRRQEESHQLELRQQQEKAALDLQIDAAKGEAAVEAQKKKAAASSGKK